MVLAAAGSGLRGVGLKHVWSHFPSQATTSETAPKQFHFFSGPKKTQVFLVTFGFGNEMDDCTQAFWGPTGPGSVRAWRVSWFSGEGQTGSLAGPVVGTRADTARPNGVRCH